MRVVVAVVCPRSLASGVWVPRCTRTHTQVHGLAPTCDDRHARVGGPDTVSHDFLDTSVREEVDARDVLARLTLRVQRHWFLLGVGMAEVIRRCVHVPFSECPISLAIVGCCPPS